ncbi:UDP-N-acetylmuramoylalanyl-D-glutamyl-2,6-diaminopimelate--D-alanyl-D-alanine ligase [Methyloceanibacter sp.]|uniref:UDP-N-acetylmuramoylalanyl-D-glutamyl-2, 6-diaminopimelate--D-alanyl-D-alanine ligase n=1 Tax=Methyloceanibacter sp. TaxID=1965321 RepID=UPI002CEE4D05|nr:UDP-N-acetylmuramoylalanyl-D-glutamyl-2,6-diaminopimelate--D-alanyl-D-alanine ligase [Methyloceanibacter sp.]HML92497.1 UDP-N-acetylmuramoylalanyl-D-glutamyl-2,6-diaminopimelate--D-alanyl-D-alanine ligase [Methyloceanibacter sp.]
MADPLWTLGEVLGATGGRCEGDPAAPVSGFSIDSRALAAGEGFIAIRGPNRDGHDYAAKALQSGAGCAIVEETFPGESYPAASGDDAKADLDESRLVRVRDTFDALNDLGRQGRDRTEHAVVIAVTGSAGKTGTKEALRAALAPSGTVHASAKSFNNHWGVPLTLANMRRDIDYGIFEVGMNHAGEISVLTRLVRPHIAIVTTVAPVHLGFFASVEEIADAKAEIFEGLEPGGTAILNRDNPHFDRLAEAARRHGAEIVGFGEDGRADARLLQCDLGADGSAVTSDVLGETISYRLGAPGRHVVQNTLAVLAAVKLAGADLAAAAGALGGVRAPAGRGERFVIATDGGPVCIVDESYNANPASMRAALQTLGLAPRSEYKRRVAVLGDMLELGQQGPRLHRDLAEAVDAGGIDVVFACGACMASLFEALPQARQGAYAKTSEDLAPALLSGVRPGDIIVVKGSLGSRMAPLVEALKRRFEHG